MVEDVITHPFLVDSSPDVNLVFDELFNLYPSDLKTKIGYVQDTCAHVFIDDRKNYEADIPELLETEIFSVDMDSKVIQTDKGLIRFA
jgi:hypothetical protein